MMRIKIINFQIVEHQPMVHGASIFQQIWKMLWLQDILVLHHFDIVIKVDERYEDHARKLNVGEHIMLPNKVRLKVWSVDRLGIIRAKTVKLIEQDLRAYHPIEMYLVYPRVHGHLTDRV